MHGSIRLVFIVIGLVTSLNVAEATGLGRTLADGCGVDIVVGCQTSDGRPCNTIDFLCKEPRPSRLSLIYTANNCTANSNEQGSRTRCVDGRSPPPNTRIKIMCRSESNRRPVIVEPESVLPGETFKLIGMFDSVLPSLIECILRDEERTMVQEVVFGTLKSDALHLMNRFGAFTLSSCGEQSCQQILSYTISIANNGTSAANLQSLVFALNSNTYDLLSTLTSPLIAAGDVVDVPGSEKIGVCKEGLFFDAVAFVRYKLLNDQLCQISGNLVLSSAISTNVPSTTPTVGPISKPSMVPSFAPTMKASSSPTFVPSSSPTNDPTPAPTKQPQSTPPIKSPTTGRPSWLPTHRPTKTQRSDSSVRSDSLSGEEDLAQQPSQHPTFLQTALPTIKKQCSISVELFCTTSDRADCMDISIPWFCPSSIKTLTLQYSGKRCQDTHSSVDCKDFESTEGLTKGLLLCVDGNGESLRVEPQGLFESHDLIIISNSLQEKIVGEANCGLFDISGTKLQTFSVPTDGNIDIVHGASIGAFQLIACSEEASCLVDFQYEIVIYNDANDGAVITDVTITSMNGTNTMLVEMIDETIPSNESLSGVYNTAFNVCSKASFQIGLVVEAMTTDGKTTCIDADTNSFVVKQPNKVKLIDQVPGTEASSHSEKPTNSSTRAATSQPIVTPTNQPIKAPTKSPSTLPTRTPSIVPTKTPSSLPTKQPIIAPTKPPTQKITMRPMPIPTASPTNPPTRKPTVRPTNEPMSAPSLKPTKSPSAAPSVTHCLATAEILCATAGGTQCKNLRGIGERKCQCTDCPSEFRFRYTAAKCSESLHFSICQDMSIDRLPTSVRIEIADIAMNTTYFNQIVDSGGDAVAIANGTCLDDDLAVFINDPVNGTLLQVLSLSLGCSGPSGTELLSDFGSVELSGYTCQNGLIRNCYGAIDWAFVASIPNFSSAQTVRRFDLVFNGETLDLLGGDPAANVPATLGGSTPEIRQAIRTRLQFCSPTFYDLKLILETIEPTGKSCTTQTMLEFAILPGEIVSNTTANPELAGFANLPTDSTNETKIMVVPLEAIGPAVDSEPALDDSANPTEDSNTSHDDLPSCGLTAIIDCQVEDLGVPCADAMQPQSPACHGRGAISRLAFSYQNINCGVADNSQPDTWLCTDASALYEGSVKVVCVSVLNDDELVVSPTVIGPGETVTVTPKTMAVLPSSIVCTLYGPGDRVLQKNLMDVSGMAPIYLGDQFGALQVEACSEMSCSDLFRYQMNVTNEGTEPLLVTEVDFSFNGSGRKSLPLQRNGLNPGDDVMFQVAVEVDICRGRVFEAAIEISAARHSRLVGQQFCFNRNSTALELPHIWE